MKKDYIADLKPIVTMIFSYAGCQVPGIGYRIYHRNPTPDTRNHSHSWRNIINTIGITLLCLLLAGVTGSCETIGQLKSIADGVSVTADGCVTSISSDECYVEAINRSAGIWVSAGTAGVNIGDCVTVMGTMDTVDGERIISSANIYPLGTQAYIGPLGMPVRSVSGAQSGYQFGVSDAQLAGTEWVWNRASGLNNTGLLIKTWGTVTATYYSPVNDAHWFFVDDGSKVTGDNDDTGVLVFSDADVSAGNFVTVTGNSSVECDTSDSTRLIRSIRSRSIEDVSIVSKVKPTRPFSDEFDKDKLDSRWAIVTAINSNNIYASSTDRISLTAEPGWVALSIPQINNSYIVNSYHLAQPVLGNWDAELKLKLCSYTIIPAVQGMIVYLTDDPSSYVYYSMNQTQNGNNMVHIYTTTDDATANTIHCWTGSDNRVLSGDTAWFKLSKRDSTLYINWSQDGINYSDYVEGEGTISHEFAVEQATGKYLVISIYSTSIRGICYPVTGYCDYIRFTQVE